MALTRVDQILLDAAKQGKLRDVRDLQKIAAAHGLKLTPKEKPEEGVEVFEIDEADLEPAE